MEDQKEFLDNFEERLSEVLVNQVCQAGYLDRDLLAVEELEERWKGAAPEYMAAAVPEIAAYPLVAIAWAGFLGMGAAVLWDTDWESYSECDDLYKVISAPRGFDMMDEYVVEGLFGYDLEGEPAKKIMELMHSAADTTHTMIRKEGIEPQSILAFHIFARATRVFYLLGVAIGLKLLGYKYEKVQIENN